MRNVKQMRENCFGWWLVDIEDELRSCSHMPPVRPRGGRGLICLVCNAEKQRTAEYLRGQQLISPTSVPSREDLFELVKSRRLGHLERHRNVLETIFGAKSARFTERPEVEGAPVSTTNVSLNSSAIVDYDDDSDVDKVLDFALRSEHVDADLVKQVLRIRQLRTELSHLRSSTRALQRDLQGLDSSVSQIVSSVRSLRRNVDDLCFLESILAAADGSFPITSSSNLII